MRRGSTSPSLEGVEREGGAAHLPHLHEIGAGSASPGGSVPASRPTPTNPCCAPTTASATASTPSSTTPRTTTSCGRRWPTGSPGAPWADDRAGAHVGPGGQVRDVDPGRGGPRLPDLDDLLDRPRPAGPARAGADVGAAAHVRAPTTRPRCRRAPSSGAHRRHGHDREAGRLRRPGQHHPGHAHQRRRGPGEEYALIGHKWFCSAPMSDLFLMLAHTDAGLSCFAVPRWLPDGTRNAHRDPAAEGQAGQPVATRRARSSSTARSAASSARRAAGIATILTMVNHTRLDCVIGVTGQMRAGLSQAVHHARHRTRVRQPAGRPAAHAATCSPTWPSSPRPPPATMLRLAGAYDRGETAVRPHRHRRRPSTGSASGRRCSPPRRSSASAAPATSRSRRCPGCSGRARSTASGRARAT